MKVGDRVKMTTKGMSTWGVSPANPCDVSGTVESIKGAWTRVSWDNGNKNSYKKGDLELLGVAPVAKELRVKKTKAGTYNIKGLSFEQLKLIGITLGVQSGEASRKTAPVYYVISDEVEKTEPDFITGYLHININLDNMKKGE